MSEYATKKDMENLEQKFDTKFEELRKDVKSDVQRIFDKIDSMGNCFVSKELYDANLKNQSREIEEVRGKNEKMDDSIKNAKNIAILQLVSFSVAIIVFVLNRFL